MLSLYSTYWSSTSAFASAEVRRNRLHRLSEGSTLARVSVPSGTPFSPKQPNTKISISYTTLTMKIKCGKETLDVSVEDLNMTIRSLKENLAEMTNYTDIKLILGGKVLKDEDAIIGSLPGGIHAKLTMMGSTAAAIESLKKSAPTVNSKRIIDDLSGEVKANGGTSKSTTDSRNRQHNPYKFERIQTLPGLPNEDKAREILQSLANDEGVLAVMKKHKWSVGALCELYPEGYVGVSDVCVMGLNENHGQRILLRLRTDDMKGFRKILSIRKVLCHELAHNEHSEHDDKFYVLMRMVEREIAELDWKTSKGRLLSGSSEAAEVYQPSASSTAAAPTVHRLGGSTDPLVQQFIPARYLAATAAIMRISAEEKEIEDHCGSSPRTLSAPQEEHPQPSSAAGIESMEEHDGVADAPAKDAFTHTEYEEMQIDAGENTHDSANPAKGNQSTRILEAVEGSREADQQSGSRSAASTVDDAAPPIEEKPETSMDIFAPEPGFPSLQTAVLSTMDDSIAFALSTESAAAPVEKMLALRDALCEIMAHFDRTVPPPEKLPGLLRCLNVLLKIVSNAKVSLQFVAVSCANCVESNSYIFLCAYAYRTGPQ